MFWTLAIPFVSLTLLTSYATRIFEGPTKARHSLYFWDQMWMVCPPIDSAQAHEGGRGGEGDDCCAGIIGHHNRCATVMVATVMVQ
jgi:hypothetical protein